jgi:hypothetical protein
VPNLSTADAVKVGSHDVDAVYLGDTEVWSGSDDLSTSSVLSTDGVWSWYSDPRFRCYQGTSRKMYGGFVRANGDIVACELDLDSRVYRETTLSAALEIDDHDNASMVVLSTGKLAFFYCKHPDTTMRVRITSNAESVASFAAEVAGPSNVSTNYVYSNPHRLTGEGTIGRVYLFWRGGSDEPTFASSDDDCATWNAGVKLLSVGGTGTRPYAKYVSDGTGKIHLFCSEGHPRDMAASTCDLFHGYYDAADGYWHKSDGTQTKTMATVRAGTPLTFSDMTKVHDASVTTGGGNGNAWPFSIELDASGHPAVAYSYYVANDDNRYRWARWDGSAWDVSADIVTGVTSLYGTGAVGEPQYAGGICVDSRNTNRVYLSRIVSGKWEMSRWITANDGANWTEETTITSGSTNKNARPFVPANWMAGAPKLVWWYGTYTHYATYNTDVMVSPAITLVEPPPTAPVNSVAPAISGSANTGQTLTCGQGTWLTTPTGTEPDSYTYQWKRNGSAISGETASTYLLVVGDESQSIKCTVTATNEQGSTTADSNTVTPTPGITTFVHDAFTDTEDTVLTAHAPTVAGGAWTACSSYAQTFKIKSNKAAANQGPIDTRHYVNTTPPGAEYAVEADLTVVFSNGLGRSGIFGRGSTNGDDHYFVRWQITGTAVIQLFKVVANAATSLGTWNEVATVGKTINLRLEIRNATKKVFVDGVERISSTDNAITGAGLVGLRSLDSTLTAGVHYDNFKAMTL